MIVIPGLTRPLAAVGKRITSWHDDDDRLLVQASSSSRWAECPKCLCGSHQVHGRYRRRLDDPPCFGQPVAISVEVRRFKCGSPGCAQRTFSERLDTLAAAGHRRAQRLNDALHSLGYALRGAAGTRLAADRRRLASTASDGQVVARDWAGAYCEAVHTATPTAQQIADRWHLLTNLREAVERLSMRQAAKLRESARLMGEALRIETQPLTADTGETVLPLSAWQRLGIDRRAARVARYEEAVHRRKFGESFKAIGRAMNIDHRTVRNFIRAGTFAERAQRTGGSTLLDGHRPYVASRAVEGCVSAEHVWHELRARDGSALEIA